MFQWLRKQREQQVRLKEVEIGDGNITVDLPFHFIVAQEEDAITVVYDPNSENVILRFSVLYVSDSKSPGKKKPAVESVHKWAKEHRQRVIKHGDLAYAAYHEPYQEGDEPGDIHYWLAGLDNRLILASCWVSRSWIDDPAAKAILNTVEPAIRSVRESKFQKYKYDENQKHEIQPLLPEHVELLDQLRQAAIDSAKAVLGRPGFTGGDSDLQVIQTLFDHPNFDKNHDLVVQGLGAIFGGILARKLNLEWVSITDGYGSTPALHHVKANIALYPIDMLVKRVERGEKIDVMYLLTSLYEETRKMIASNTFSKRHPRIQDAISQATRILKT